MFKKKTEEIKQIIDEKTKEMSDKAVVVTIGLTAAASLTVGYIVGALSSAILFSAVKK